MSEEDTYYVTNTKYYATGTTNTKYNVIAKDTNGKISYIEVMKLRDALEEVAKIKSFGDEKYGAGSHRSIDPTLFIDAAYRHLFKHLGGTERDSESGELHLAHATTNLLLALENYKSKR